MDFWHFQAIHNTLLGLLFRLCGQASLKLMSISGKKILLFESVVNIIAGLLLGLLFTRSGLMSGIGILCMAAMLLRMGFRVWKIYKIESAE